MMKFDIYRHKTNRSVFLLVPASTDLSTIDPKPYSINDFDAKPWKKDKPSRTARGSAKAIGFDFEQIEKVVVLNGYCIVGNTGEKPAI